QPVHAGAGRVQFFGLVRGRPLVGGQLRPQADEFPPELQAQVRIAHRPPGGGRTADGAVGGLGVTRAAVDRGQVEAGPQGGLRPAGQVVDVRGQFPQPEHLRVLRATGSARAPPDGPSGSSPSTASATASNPRGGAGRPSGSRAGSRNGSGARRRTSSRTTGCGSASITGGGPKVPVGGSTVPGGTA